MDTNKSSIGNPYNIGYMGTNEKSCILTQDLQTDNTRALVKNCINCHYLLNQRDYELASQWFDPNPIKFSNGDLHRHPHPVPAMLNSYAYKKCIDFAKDKRAIDVGGSFHRTPKKHHLCTLVNDSRTDQRYTEASLCLGKDLNEDYDYLHVQRKMCIAGAENCQYAAPYGYAINVYDITIEQIAKIMLMHNMLIFDLWIFLPHNIIDRRLCNDQTIYKNEIVVEKGIKICKFSLLDGANIYRHSYYNWYKFFSTTKIVLENAAIVVEHKESLNTFTNIRFTMVDNKMGTIERVFNLSTLYKDVIQVPNLLHYFMYNMAATDPFRKSYIVNAQFVNKIIDWAVRCKDDGYTFPSLCAYSDGCKNNVFYTVNGAMTLVYKGIDVDSHTYQQLKLTLFILGAVYRYNRTKNIGEIYTFIKTQKSIFLPSIRHMIKKNYVKMRDNLRVLVHSSNVDGAEDIPINIFFKPLTDDPTYIFNICCRSINNIYFNDVINVNYLRTDRYVKIDHMPFENMQKLWCKSNDDDENSAIAMDEAIGKTDMTESEDTISITTISDISSTDSEMSTTSSSSINYIDRLSLPDSDTLSVQSEEIQQIKHTTPVSTDDELDKVTIAKWDQYTDLIKNKINVNLTHCKVLHNPIADGDCASRCFNEFAKKINKNVIYKPYTYFDINGAVHKMNRDWLNIDEVAAIANRNLFNIIIHHVNTNSIDIYKYYLAKNLPIIKLMLKDQHWTLIDCDCVIDEQHYVGRYAQIKMDEHVLYVNCANRYLTDGAGQAKDFNEKFPNYKRNIQKPIRNNCLFTKYNKNNKIYHLCVAVAYDNTPNKDIGATNRVLRDIMIQINKYCNDNNLTVFLPSIGTSLFKGDLCCFKNATKLLTCRVVFCHYNDDNKKLFDQTKDCTHGGFNLLTEKQIRPKIDNYDPKFYDSLLYFKKDKKMEVKIIDIYNMFVKLNVEKKPVIEISAAPGKFYSYVKNNKSLTPLEPWVYVGKEDDPTILDWMHTNVKVKQWSNSEDLLGLMQNRKEVNYILDYFCDDYDLLDDIHDNLLENGGTFTTKFESFNITPKELDTFDRCFEGVKRYYWRNEGTEHLSSEIYVTYYDFKNDLYIPQKTNIAPLLQKIDEIQLGVQEKHVCACDVTPLMNRINARIVAEIDTNKIESFIKYINDDTLVKKDYINMKINNFKTMEIKAILGVGGNKKSKTALDSTCCQCAIIVAPLKQVANQHKELPGVIATTFMKAINIIINRVHNKRPFKYIIMDEYLFTHPYMAHLYKHLSPTSEIIGLSDPKQIQYLDLDANAPKYEIKYDKPYEITTYRSPQVIVDLCKNYIVGIKTMNKNVGKIIRKNTIDIFNIDEKLVANFKRRVILTHTQDMKEKLASQYKQFQVHTVTEVMGCTFDSIHIYTPDINKLYSDRDRYVYTALGRTASQLVVYGDAEEIEHYFTILNTPIENAIDAHEIIPTDEHYVVTEPIEETTLNDKIYSLNQITKTADVEEILSRVFVPKNDVTTQNVSYQLRIVKENKGSKMKASDALMTAEDYNVIGARIGEKMMNIPYSGKDNFKMLTTAVSRYSKHHKVPKRFLHKYVKGFEKFLKKDWRSLLPPVTTDEMWKSVQDYLVALQKKLGKEQSAAFNIADKIIQSDMQLYYIDQGIAKIQETSLEQLKNKNLSDQLFKSTKKILNAMLEGDLFDAKKYTSLQTEWTERSQKLVDFHMKSQPKEVRDLYYDTVDKDGQGVSAWTKMLNVIFSALTRSFANRLDALIKDNVILAYAKSDKDISDKFIKFSKTIEDCRGIINFMCDFGQFDSSQEKIGVLSRMIIFLLFGFPEKLCYGYIAQRRNWMLAFQGQDKIAYETLMLILEAEWVMSSGCPDTLHGNTVFNISAIGMCFDIKDMIFASFKGDDSVMQAHSIKDNFEGGKTHKEICGYNLKIHNYNIMEYIANVMTPNGFFPDVIRRSSRIISKIYTHPDKWDEIKMSTADALQVIRDESHLNMGCHYLEKFYNQLGLDVTESEIRYLLSYLQNIVYDDSLKPTCNAKYVFNKIDPTMAIVENKNIVTIASKINVEKNRVLNL